MQITSRKLTPLFSALTLGMALYLVGCDEEPAKPVTDTPTSDVVTAPAVTPPVSVTPGPTPGPDEGMPQVLFLMNSTAAFTATNSSVNQSWANHWEQEAQPHHAQLMQVPENAALFQNFVAQFAGLKDAPLVQKIQAVNEAVNGYVTYTADNQLYGRDDYWASPVETLKTRRGDCEDYAILKYYVLRAMGVDDNRLYLTSANMNGNGQAGPDHLVLLANVSDDKTKQSFLMLDNNAPEPVDAVNIRYSLYHAFNDAGYWGYKPDYLAMAAQPPVKTENNGRVVGQDGALIIDGGRVVVQQGGAVIIDGGRVVVQNGSVTVNGVQIVSQESAMVTIDGGSVVVQTGSGVIVNGGKTPVTVANRPVKQAKVPG